MRTSNQKTTDLLIAAARIRGLDPLQLTDYGLIRITVQDRFYYLAYSHSPLNTQLAMYLASNKHATRIALEQAGLPNIPYTLPANTREAFDFIAEHQKVIMKPTFGHHSHDVHLLTPQSDLTRYDLSHYLFEKYIAGRELRYLVLNGEVIAVHRKDYTPPINDPASVKRISYPKKLWDTSHVKYALLASKVIGLKLAAVDFLIDDQDQPHILEVNSAPGIEWFHRPTDGPAIDLAGMLLDAYLEQFLE